MESETLDLFHRSPRWRQMRLCVLGILVLVLCQEAAAAAATDSVVSGRAISNAYMDHTKINCPTGDICMNAWFRWTIDAVKTLRGPPVTGRITAVRMQHSTAIRSYERQLRLFVLRPIADPKQRALLRSDYYLVSTSFAAASAGCDSAQLVEIRSLAKLPSDIRRLLPSTNSGLDGIADRGARFNETDVIDRKLPMRRFTLAGVGATCALIAVEHGGFVSGIEVTEYHLTAGEWRPSWRRPIPREPSTVPELLRAAP